MSNRREGAVTAVLGLVLVGAFELVLQQSGAPWPLMAGVAALVFAAAWSGRDW